MAEFKRVKLEKIVTPVAVAVWPWLNKPDTKFNTDGEYRVKLKLNKDDDATFLATLEKKADEAYEAAIAEMNEKGGKFKATAKEMKKHVPIEPEYDEEGDETGFVFITVKAKASGTTKEGKKWERKLNIFDAKAVAMKNPPAIYGGSLLKVEAEISPFSMPATKTAGISLRINAIQVLELSSGSGGGTASSHGFGVEDDYEGLKEVEVPTEIFEDIDEDGDF